MMVPGMNFFREPERTSAVVNLPVLLLLRVLPLPTSHGGQTTRPSVQNGGMVRNGFEEIGLMSIKNGTLVTTDNGTIGSTLRGI